MSARRVDQALARLRESSWHGRSDRSGFYAAVVRETRRRYARRLALGLPLALALAACATYGALRSVHTFATEVDVTLDGEPAGTRTVAVQVVDGEVQPLRLEMGAHGSVELHLEIPEGVDPTKLRGMRVVAELTTDP